MNLPRSLLPSLAALQAFEASARHLSFTRAAEELNLSQGAISRQVLALESALGLPLFVRVRQRISLTPAGASYAEEVREALKPGGYLFVTTPAFPQFWSYNDDMGNHLRRYCHSDFSRLARQSGLILCDSRYFMFFLSPLYLLSRIKPAFESLTPVQKRLIILKQHKVQPTIVNSVLSTIFSAETPLGFWLRFPWGTSILGVFKKT